MKYGFIGCGNMGGALARAVSHTTKDIMLSDFDAQKAQQFAAKLGVTAADNATIAKECDRIFLGVKPQIMQDMLCEIKTKQKKKKPLLITMAAGLKISKIQSLSDLTKIKIIIHSITKEIGTMQLSIGNNSYLFQDNGEIKIKTFNNFIDVNLRQNMV